MTAAGILVFAFILTFSLEILKRVMSSLFRIHNNIIYLWLTLLVITGILGRAGFGVNLPKQAPDIDLTFLAVGTGIILLMAYNSKYSPGKTISGIAIFCVVFPVGEEILFRGIIQSMLSWIPGLGQTYLRLPLVGTCSAVVAISAFLFAINHLQYHNFRFTPIAARQIVIAFIGGVVMGTLVLHTGTILSSLVVHMAFNISATLFSFKKNEICARHDI